MVFSPARLRGGIYAYIAKFFNTLQRFKRNMNCYFETEVSK
jgi:hypothetical protein